jgi:hypothetical protein
VDGDAMPGAQIIELLISWVVTTAVTFLLVIVDERRLSEERLERAWLPTSRTLLLVYFGLLAIPFHFAKTRGTWTSARGIAQRLLWFVLGIVIAVIVAVASSLLITVIVWATGLPMPD